MEKDNKTAPLGLALGALTAGVILGLIFAPKKGSELREDLGDAFRRNRDKALSLADKMGEKIPSRLGVAAKDVAAEALRSAKEKAAAVLSA